MLATAAGMAAAAAAEVLTSAGKDCALPAPSAAPSSPATAAACMWRGTITAGLMQGQSDGQWVQNSADSSSSSSKLLWLLTTAAAAAADCFLVCVGPLAPMPSPSPAPAVAPAAAEGPQIVSAAAHSILHAGARVLGLRSSDTTACSSSGCRCCCWGCAGSASILAASSHQRQLLLLLLPGWRFDCLVSCCSCC